MHAVGRDDMQRRALMRYNGRAVDEMQTVGLMIYTPWGVMRYKAAP